MGLRAHSHVSSDSDSRRAGEEVGLAVKQAFGGTKLKAVIVYATVNHEQAAVLSAVRSSVGSDVSVVGCSAQGVVSQGAVMEEGFAVGAVGLGGDALESAVAVQHEIQQDGAEKGRALAREVRAALGEMPKVLIVLYDPLCGADMDQLLGGMRAEVDCPIVGGGASQPWGPMVRTYQYFGDAPLAYSVVALGLAGPFTAELGVCHGTSPTGIEMTLTRALGTKLLEFDGQPAEDVFRETLGLGPGALLSQDQTAALALGIQRRHALNGELESTYFIRAAFGFDDERKAIIVQTAIPENTTVMFHHRTVQAVKRGTSAMGQELASRLAGKKPWAVLGFECGARTSPFLGSADTLEENLELQKTVAPSVPWLGFLAWGELAPCAGEPAFHNYTYPLLVLAD